MSSKPRSKAPGSRPLFLSGTPSLSAGYLAAFPLFSAYELGLALSVPATVGPETRAAAERVVTHVLSPIEWPGQGVRIALLSLLAIAALLRMSRNEISADGLLSRRLGRLAFEGVLIGILLGPTLSLLQEWLAAEPLLSVPTSPRSLPASLRLVGAAPWEELLFRVGLFGGVFVLVRRVSSFLGLETSASRFGAELTALLGSALLFAWFHLDSAQRLLGGQGEPFHRGLFLWRVSAGICLGGLFRWRGFGVASWAHAVFNLGIALGIRP